MNIKLMLIEKERIAYAAGDLHLAEFFDATLQYILGLEEQINRRDSADEGVATVETSDAQETLL